MSFFDGSSQANAVVTSPTGEVIVVGFIEGLTASNAGIMFALVRFAKANLIFKGGFE